MIGIIRMLAGVKVEVGELTTPGGIPYKGFKITLGGVSNPDVKRTYEDIVAILHSQQQPYKEFETKTKEGKFKSFVIEA